jgi:hypothetical protein
VTFIPSARAPESAFSRNTGIPDGANKLVWVPPWKPGTSAGYHGWWSDSLSEGNEQKRPGTGKYQYVHGGGDAQNHTTVADANGNYISNPRYERTDGSSTPRELADQQPHTMWIEENVFKADTLQLGEGWAADTMATQYIDSALREAIRSGQASHDQERTAQGKSTSKELRTSTWGGGIQAEPEAWKNHYLTVKYDRPAGLLKLA